VSKTEFTVQNAYKYTQTSDSRWNISHVLRYRWFFLLTVLLYVGAYSSYTGAQVLVGKAVQGVLEPTGTDVLPRIALSILGLLILDGLCNLIGTISVETIAQRLEVDARDELYRNLLGKSQSFHSQQRVGDIMARATDDVQQLNGMMNPGVAITIETLVGIVVPRSTPPRCASSCCWCR
jgi:ATP-binding cassette subfamily B protein